VIVMIFRPQGLLGYVEMNFYFVRIWWNKIFRRGQTSQEG